MEDPRRTRRFCKLAAVLSIASGSAVLAFLHTGRKMGGAHTSPPRLLQGDPDFVNAGTGICQRASYHHSAYHHGVGFSGCRTTCFDSSLCTAFAVSSSGNCMIWHGDDVTGGGGPWGGASCWLRIMPTSTTTTASTSTASTSTATTSSATTTTASATSTTTVTTTTVTTSTSSGTETSTTTSTSSETDTTTSETSTTTSATSSTTTPTATTITTTSTSSLTETTTSSATTSTTTTTSSSTSTSSTTTTTNTSTATTLTTSTTSSSNTSTVTSSTLTATNTTTTPTTTTSTTTPYVAVSSLIHRIEELEDLLVTPFVKDSTTNVIREDRIAVFATSIDEAAVVAAGGSLSIPVEGSEAEVVVPLSLFANPDIPSEGVVLMIAIIDLTDKDFTSNMSEPEVQVAGVVNVNVLSVTGRRLDISDLDDPLKVEVPANYSTGLECAFWDQSTTSWAAKGMKTGTFGEGTLECWTTHLTLFGAIIRGFVQTVACSQVTLLNAESIKEMGKGGWQTTLGASVLWGVLATFTVFMLAAAWLDKHRRSHDENLLIPLRDTEEDPPPPVEEPADEEQGEEEPAEDAQASTKWRVCCACAACREWAGSSGALRDAADEVFSQWFNHFGEVRDLVEGLIGGLECGCPTWGQVVGLIHRFLTKLLVMSACRQAAAVLNTSWDTSALVTEPDEVSDVVQAHRSHRSLNTSTTTLSRGLSTTTLAREETWGELHRGMEVRLDTVMEESAHWSSLPRTVWRLFLHGNPIVMCMVRCVFMSRKLRVLFFMVDIFGSQLLGAVFFSASGIPGKNSRGFDCGDDDLSTWMYVGRVLAVGIGSLLFAGIPGIFLESFCTRSMKKLDYEGGPQWKKQLRVWQIQDRAIWIMGSLYVAFCLFFVCLFLANVDEEDHAEWLLSGLFSVVLSLIIIPLVVALVLALLVMMCLHLISSHRRVAKEDVISEMNLKFKSNAGMDVTVGRV